MIQHVETVVFGRPATRALSRHIGRAQEAGALQPVTVVVASNFVGLSVRRLLAGGALGGNGLANVSFVTPFQVAELLAPGDIGGRRPLTNPVLGAAVRQALAADPGPFAEVVGHPATEAAVAALYGELSQVPPTTLDVLTAAGGTAALSVRLVRDVASRLGGFYGEPDLVRAVAERPDLDQVVSRLGQVVWFLPEPGTPALEQLVAALLHHAPSSVVVGLTGASTVDVAVVELCGRVGVRVDPVAPAAAVEPVGVATDGAGPAPVGVVTASDPDDEVREVVRRIAELAESGVRFDRIGVFYPSADPYVALLHHHLAEAELPANGPSTDRLADSVAGRTLLGALSLPDHQWRRDRVMALVAAAPLRHGGEAVHPAAWELVSRVAGVVNGLADWSIKLGARSRALRERIESLTEADHPDRAIRLGRDLADVTALDSFVTQLARQVAAVSEADGWSARCEAARHLLTHLLGEESSRQWWPDPEIAAADRVLDTLTRLSLLDEIEPRPSLSVFVRALAGELDVGRGRSGRVGQGVTFGPLASGVGQDLDAVFLLGMSEGRCPRTRRDDSLLPDSVRRLAPPGQFRLRAAQLDDQHRWVLGAGAAAPAGRRWYSVPRGDLRAGGASLPSRWVIDGLSSAAGRRVTSDEVLDGRLPGVEDVESFSHGIRGTAVHASLRDRDLAQLSELAPTHIASHPAVTGAIGRGITALRARRSGTFTEWDGNLAGVEVPSPTRGGSPLSPTGLEQWAGCGFRYFLDHVIGLRDRDEPERIHEISAIDRGSAVHAILERFFAEVIEQGAPDPDQAWTSADRQRLAEIAAAELDELERTGRTGRAVTWRFERRRLLDLLDRFLTEDEGRRALWRSRPVDVEMPFGLADADPVVIDLADGRAIRFRGLADRVDRTDGGEWIVLDYKTGAGTRYKGLADDDFMAGTTLQLGLYSEAAQQRLGGGAASAYYWMVDERAGFVPHGYRWTDDRRARFVELLGSMVDGIEQGVFPLVPGDWDAFQGFHDNCRFCQYDPVCPADRGPQAEAKVDAPQLAVRRTLTSVPVAPVAEGGV